MGLVSYARRLQDLAAADPGRPAVTDERATVTRAELERLANRFAHTLAAQGVVAGDRVTVARPNSVEFVAAVCACWKLGATPQPVSARLPARELDAIVALAAPRVVVDDAWDPDDGAPDDPLPDAVSDPWKAMTSGGSTGRPKLILAGGPGLIDPDANPMLMIRRDGTHLMPGPLYHNGPFVWTTTALLAGNHVVLGGRFDAQRTLELVDRYRPDSLYLVPTMMARIWKLPPEVRGRYDVSSLQVVWHLAAPCPPWLKQAWIDWLGAERIWELYAGTEAQAATVINGVEWLAHRGSVGRPVPPGEMKAFGPAGEELPPGEVGEIYLRSSPDGSVKTYEYVGARARTLPGGWESLGDMGWVDEDGYVYLTDRQTDMILVGGANVYPAEVEAALDEHPRVRSSAVIGLPDDDLGNRPHAVVQTDDGTPIPDDELRAHLAERLAHHKIPRTFEFVVHPLRDDAGKVRRSALRAERC
ncbi:MAG: putative acid-CoA ligase [Acidimicrobiia bacterium]|nr:MAG: putative acid-CoA ligase [Acidimicrobiia bacterium]